MFRFDETDPDFLIVYTGTDEPHPDNLRNMIRRWAAKIEAGQPFGMVLVSEPHEHSHDERDGEQEAATTKLINEFRRDYRARNNQVCWGYANVLTPEIFAKSPEDAPAKLEQMQARTQRFAAYIFGVRGRAFIDLEVAKTWLKEQADLPPLDLTDGIPQPDQQPRRVGLFYGSTTGVTEYVAADIAQAWQDTGMEPLSIVNITDIEHLAEMLAFDHLILGISTWNIGQLQDDWELRFNQLDELDFSGKQVAIFGVGDQVNYAENFQDAVGIIAVKLRARGAMLAGVWPTAGYEFEVSLALEDGQLLGLAIDEVSQHAETADRIARWVAQLRDEWQLQPAVAETV